MTLPTKRLRAQLKRETHPATADAKRLRTLLERAGLTPNQAARELDMGERMMRYYCAGTHAVPRIVWLALERVIELRGVTP